MGLVLGFGKIDRTQGAIVGGKGANLGELSRVDGIRVPTGFCVTTEAYRHTTATISALDDVLDRLAHTAPDDLDAIRSLSAEIRRVIEESPVPDEVAKEVTAAYMQLGGGACAVRSSATAEDLPSASFAGQHDSYLNVIGVDEVLKYVKCCWASLFTERAVVYRQRNGLDHRMVRMAVVVQRMVDAQTSGIMFTADPLTSNRKVVSIDAGFGLGEALVSGTVDADTYKVRDGEIIGTVVQSDPVLTDAQAVHLAQLGRKIEAHFGSPQDIEWCLVDGNFHVVQSRPITTLFPIPESDDDKNRVYVSVGHQQMMTDAMKPLGISVWQATSPASMRHAGARLFVDVTEPLAHPATRGGMIGALAKSDPLVGDALRTVLDRDFIATVEDGGLATAPRLAAPEEIETDRRIVEELVAYSDESNETARREIRTKQGAELLEFIIDDILELRRLLFHPKSLPAIMASVDTAEWLNSRMQEWLGEKNAADVLSQSVSHNVTSEMGLALLDVADAIRPYPEVVEFLRHVADDDGEFLDRLEAHDGGKQARAVLESYLNRYGMRCVGEIDITRTRWSEQPAILAPVIVSNIDNFEPGEATRRFDKGLREAQAKERELLERLRELPDGEAKADETKRMIDRLRTFAGYREYPKYAMVGRYFEYKKALLGEGQRLVDGGVLTEKEDIFYLRLDELRDLVRTQEPCEELIRRRKDEFDSYRILSAPRVLTSEGEGVTGAYRRDDLPAGALPGTAVSTGVVEGRARVIVDMAQADLDADDILVTRFTDPSWTPLFVTVTGLVTEVGGLMTHGAVIAREYGLPAVVGVENATSLIRDGQWIRVNGTDGYVEILR